MKKFAIIALLFGLTLSINAQGIEFFKGTFAEAQAEAQKQGKLIFMDAYASWCGPCKNMAKKVFPQKSVGDFYNQNFINLKVDMEKGEGKELRKKYKVSAYPTLFFINPDGSVALTQRGAQSANGLVALGKRALVPNQKAVNKMKQDYKSGNREPAFLYNYVNTLSKLDEDVTEPFKTYLSGLSTEELTDKKNLNLIFNSTNSINSPGYSYLTKYGKLIQGVYGTDKYSAKMGDIASGTIKEAVSKKDEALMLQGVKMLKKAKVPNFKKKMAASKMRYYGKVKDWDNYAKNANKYIKKYEKNNSKALNDVAWNYYMFVDEPKHLSTAIGWAEQAKDLDNNYQNNLTHAYLLYKLGKYSEAQDAVEYALILSKDDKVNTKNAEILKGRIDAKLAEATGK